MQSYQCGVVLRFFGLGLIECGLKEPRIDFGENISLLDELSFGEQHVLQFAVDLRMDGDSERWIGRAKPGQINRHILGRDGGNSHCNRRSGLGRAGSIGLYAPYPGKAAGAEDKSSTCQQNRGDGEDG